MRAHLIAPVVIAALALGGCRQGHEISGISDSTFVATMASLHAIERNPALDSAGKAAARRAALQERGLSPDGLERAARALASDPEHAIKLWTRIDSALQKMLTAQAR